MSYQNRRYRVVDGKLQKRWDAPGEGWFVTKVEAWAADSANARTAAARMAKKEKARKEREAKEAKAEAKRVAAKAEGDPQPTPDPATAWQDA